MFKISSDVTIKTLPFSFTSFLLQIPWEWNFLLPEKRSWLKSRRRKVAQKKVVLEITSVNVIKDSFFIFSIGKKFSEKNPEFAEKKKNSFPILISFLCVEITKRLLDFLISPRLFFPFAVISIVKHLFKQPKHLLLFYRIPSRCFVICSFSTRRKKQQSLAFFAQRTPKKSSYFIGEMSFVVKYSSEDINNSILVSR